MTSRNIIRSIYFYSASLITLIMIVVSAGQLVDIALKSTIFPKAEDPYGQACNDRGELVYKGDIGPRPVMPDGSPDVQPKEREMSAEEKASAKAACEESLKERRSAERQSQIVRSLSMLIVAVPVFWFHFRIAQREREEEKGLARKNDEKA